MVIKGDMNAHTGILGERINQNREKLAEFVNDVDFENLNETMAGGHVT